MENINFLLTECVQICPTSFVVHFCAHIYVEYLIYGPNKMCLFNIWLLIAYATSPWIGPLHISISQFSISCMFSLWQMFTKTPSVNLRLYFWTYPRYAMTSKQESKRQWFMSNYIYIFLLYNNGYIYITNGSLNFRLDSRLWVITFHGYVQK